jgi:uncharacterized RDD family membrane protein YckC
LKLPDQATIPGEMMGATPAGFWLRLAAFIIDNIFIGIAEGVILTIVLGIIFVVFPNVFEHRTLSEVIWDILGTPTLISMPLIGWLGYFGRMLIEMAYWTVAIGWKGRTVGKMMLGMKVVRPDGSRVSYLRAFGRYWGYVLCYLTLGFGFLAIAWNKQKRGLHDLVCDTMVIKI